MRLNMAQRGGDTVAGGGGVLFLMGSGADQITGGLCLGRGGADTFE